MTTLTPHQRAHRYALAVKAGRAPDLAPLTVREELFKECLKYSAEWQPFRMTLTAYDASRAANYLRIHFPSLAGRFQFTTRWIPDTPRYQTYVRMTPE